MGRLPISTSGLGIVRVCSCRRVPRPPHRITAVMSSRPTAGHYARPRPIRVGLPRMASVTVDPGIFKAYDVRGLYPDQMDAQVAEQLGRGFVRVVSGLAGTPQGELRIGLGRDMRPAAPELAERYRAGMMAEGAHVL